MRSQKKTNRKTKVRSEKENEWNTRMPRQIRWDNCMGHNKDIENSVGTLFLFSRDRETIQS